ncbi:MAG: hypothetical protein LBD79_06580 [Treponema sp.]|jgi:hypothetical protein|nr:hypothetical protein [Treponema sp.]
MLTKRQNFLETIHGGKPDRFVKSFEFLNLFFATDPITGAAPPFPPIGGESITKSGRKSPLFLYLAIRESR